ncbi:Rpp14/Pop5 family protein [Methanobrevibacter sp. DSM 116169]|uniref:Rpp14/Pop5 family protein n=1 Tax=Methanobrevibacter sp. DSM 116169 TaxID=3242727 RepID=UPI0038FD21F2
MKLKILPPTLRKNKRYIAIDVISESPLTKDDLVIAIWDACIRFKGELETSNFNLWLMRFYDINDSEDYYHYKAVIKCQRGFENQIRASLCVLTKYKNNSIAINSLGLSGTISSAISKFIEN